MKFLKIIFAYVSSMKTGLMLLALIAIISALGSIIMPEVFFRTTLFKTLLILVVFNMAFCSLKRMIQFNWSLLKINQARFVREFGIMLLHVGIILTTVGAGLGLMFGQSAEIALRQGQTADISSQMMVSKPLVIHLDRFTIEYNDDGSASQYYSQVQIEEGNVVKKKTVVSVNHPLEYENIKVYQESFLYKVKVKITDSAQNDTESLLEEGESLKIQGSENTVKVYRYIPNYDPDFGMYTKTLRPDNPHVIFSVYEKDSLQGVGVAKIGESIKLDNSISFVFSEIEPYTSLRLKSDPGLPVTTAGGILLMLGVLIAWLTVGRVPSHNIHRKAEMQN